MTTPEHYKSAIEPVTYIMANDLDFLSGNVVKYLTRHKRKGGREDILKAIHYCEMILEHCYQEKHEN